MKKPGESLKEKRKEKTEYTPKLIFLASTQRSLHKALENCRGETDFLAPIQVSLFQEVWILEIKSHGSGFLHCNYRSFRWL